MQTAQESPLARIHQQREAELQDYAGLEIVSTFGEPQAEYAAVHKSAGLLDAHHRAVIELTGKDRLTFLNQLVTNQICHKQTKAPLAAGQGVYAFLLNAKSGRIEFDLNVIERGDRTLIETDRRLVPELIARLEKYHFSEQVAFADVSADLHELVIHGPAAAEILTQLLGAPIDVPTDMGSMQASLGAIDIVIWRDDSCGVPGYHLIVPRSEAEGVWQMLLDRFGQSQDLGKRLLRPFGWAVYNTLRIEAGRPLFGIDFDNTVLPAETGQLGRAVSFTKGCYPGQEIVARMQARQQWARQIVGLRLGGDALPIAGAPIYDDASNQVGAVTSSTISPILSNAALALAIVKKPFSQLGMVVSVAAEGALHRATVAAMPFVPVQR